MPETAVQVLMDRLGLDDDELLTALDLDPLSVVSGEVEHKPQLALLLTLTEAPAERLGLPRLRAWVRATGRHGRPLDLLLARDYGGFEDALADLDERGFVIRGGR